MAEQTCVVHEDGKQEHQLPVVAVWDEKRRKDHGGKGPTHYECSACGQEFEVHLLKFPKF